MRIDISPEALDRLTEQLPESGRLLKLAYDTEGCGCAVNGVVGLWRVKERLNGEMAAYEGPVTIVYDPRQEVFFEERLRLDYNEKDRGFSLKSNGQIYHPSLSVIDKTGGESA